MLQVIYKDLDSIMLFFPLPLPASSRSEDLLNLDHSSSGRAYPATMRRVIRRGAMP